MQVLTKIISVVSDLMSCAVYS